MPSQPSRRRFLATAGAFCLSAPLVAPTPTEARTNATARAPDRARILIIGAGPGGCATARRLRALMPSARITLVDPSESMTFQPDMLLTANGLRDPAGAKIPLREIVPEGVSLLQNTVTDIDPLASRIRVGTTGLDYDYLVVACGAQLDFSHIRNMSKDVIGLHGIASLYAGPEAASASWRVLAEFSKVGGIAHFVAPDGILPFPEASHSQIMLLEDLLWRMDTRKRSEVFLYTNVPGFHANPQIDQFVSKLLADRKVVPRSRHSIVRINPAARTVVYATGLGEIEYDYDFIHVTPRARAPAFVTNAGLSDATGLLSVDRSTLASDKYANIFGLGDVTAIAEGKSYHGIVEQASTIAQNISALATGRRPSARFSGRNEFQLATRRGRLVRAQYDYRGEVWSLDRGDPLEESWLSWFGYHRLERAAFMSHMRKL